MKAATVSISVLLLVLSWASLAQQKTKTDNSEPQLHCSLATGEVIANGNYKISQADVRECKKAYIDANRFVCESRYLIRQEIPACEGIPPDINMIKAAHEQCANGRKDICEGLLPLPETKKISTVKKVTAKK